MVDLRFMGCIVKMTLLLESFDSFNVHANVVGLGTSTHVCSRSINDPYIIKQHGSHAWYGCWTIKALVEAEMLYDGFYCESWVHSSAVDHSKTFSCLIINK
jgi:hypothetical protein